MRDETTIPAAVRKQLDAVADPQARALLAALFTNLPTVLAAARDAAVKRVASRLVEESGQRVRLKAELESLRSEVRMLRGRVEKARQR